MRKELGDSVGTVLYFAGEAVEWESPDSVDGAYSSGLRNAKCIEMGMECHSPAVRVSQFVATVLSVSLLLFA